MSRYDVGQAFEGVWDPEIQPDQLACLAELIATHDPARIGISTSADFAHADGLTATERDALCGALGPGLAGRLESAQPLAVGWLETRLVSERETFASACAVAHRLLRRGLSDEAITPGVTTTDDLVWWYRQAVHDAGLTAWFHPTVSVQRSGRVVHEFSSPPGDIVIARGDLVHVDFGIVWKDLCTDQQEHLYVLEPGGSTPPHGLRDGMRLGLRHQDAVMDAIADGRSGNEILAMVRALAERRGDVLTGTRIRSAITATGQDPRLDCGPGRTACQERVITASSPILRTRSNSAWNCRSLSGMDSGFESCSNRTPGSTAHRASFSPVARRTSGCSVECVG